MLDQLKIANIIKKQIINRSEKKQNLLWPKFLEEFQFQNKLKNLFDLNEFNTIKDVINEYKILAVDGSQIYPDRHEGSEACLINIGLAYFDYKPVSQIDFKTYPYFYRSVEEIDIKKKLNNKNIIDEKRSSLEFEHAINFHENSELDLILMDGNIPEYDQTILSFFNKLQIKNTGIIFYTSLPGSRELISLIKDEDTQYLKDRDLFSEALAKNSYSSIFYDKYMLYGEHSKSFLYFNNGYEIVRLEFPFWCKDNIDFYLKIIVDQIKKGLGYPISLAESHMQAVVNQADKNYFYKLIRFFDKTSLKSYKLQRKSLMPS